MIKEGNYVYFPSMIRAGVYKVIKRNNTLNLYRNSSFVPLTDNLSVDIIKQPFVFRFNRDWEDVEGVISYNHETKESSLENYLFDDDEYSGYSCWYEFDKMIFPYEELLE